MKNGLPERKLNTTRITSQMAKLTPPIAMARLPSRCVRAGIPKQMLNNAAARIDQTKTSGGFGKRQKAAMPKTPLTPARDMALQVSGTRAGTDKFRRVKLERGNRLDGNGQNPL